MSVARAAIPAIIAITAASGACSVGAENDSIATVSVTNRSALSAQQGESTTIVPPAVTFADLVAPSQLAPRSPKNDTSRCIFAAAKAATLKSLGEPGETQRYPDGSSKSTYTLNSGGTLFTADVTLDTTSEKFFIEFDGTFPGALSTVGSVLIPRVDDDIEASLNAMEASDLVPGTVMSSLYEDGYTVNKNSAIYRGGHGSTVDGALYDDVAVINCDSAVEIINSLR